MNAKRPPKLGLRDFIADLRRADPLFWIVLALVALLFAFRLFID